MDKSQSYIRMCAGAFEIQKHWHKAHGDVLAYADGRVECWLQNRPSSQRLKSGFDINSSGGVVHLTKYVWLPKLNQLIEMAQVKGKRYETVTQEYFDWVKTDHTAYGAAPKDLFKSMEQLWLAFLMEKKFGKHWDGSVWVRFKPTPCEIIDLDIQ